MARDTMEPAISCSLGALGTVLAQLDELIKPGQSLPRGISKSELEDLAKELKEISTAIMDISKEENTSFTDKCWMKEVREICYDVEDYLMHKVLDSRAVVRGSSSICYDVEDYLISEDISELRASLQDARRRHERWQLPELMRTRLQQDEHQRRERCRPALAGLQTTVNRILQTPGAVLDQPMKELIDLLAFDGEPKLKVISIFGFACVGKTTLATRLYHHYGERFHCRAFLRVSRNPDTRRLLTSLLSQIKGPRSQACCDVQDLVNNVHEHLRGKCYLVIVDDLWATTVWDIIIRAFPEGDCCSRIITTTQAEDVALACCSYYSNNMYEMRPFSADQSQQLHFRNSEGMQEVLNLMYNNLPDHLKTCLLYLNMYPEDYVIPKNDLVKQWVAEGFIGAVEGQDREELAGSYFDDLVTRGMIQTAETNYNNEVLSCTVHHIVLDLIARKSVEENFITVVEYFETVTGFADKVRRLCLKFGGSKSVQIPGNFRISPVRSLLFSGFFKCVPSMVKFRLLRVLILYVWAEQEKKTFDPTGICKLFLLRYLKIVCNVAVKLPAQMQDLELLETLEVDATIVEAVPADIVCLKRLLHLLLPCDTVMPEGIGQIISLRTLGNFDLSSNLGDSLLSLGQLTNLQDLHLTCTVLSNHVVSNMDRVASILGKITNLKCLVLDGASSSQSISCDGLSSVSPSPALLERIELSPRTCIISSFPRWIGELSKLHTLKIALRELSSDDVDILKVLPALAALLLYVRTASAERILITKEGFSVLKYFKLMCTAPCIAFAEGAMHTVRRLKLGFTADKTKQYSPVDAGFKHLTGLEVFSAKIGGADESGREAVQYSFEDAFSQHPSPPVINIQWVDSIFETDKGKQADSRITLSPGASSRMRDPESSSHVQNPDEQHPIRPNINFVTGTIQFLCNVAKEDQKLHVQLECDLRYIKDELEIIQKDMKNDYNELQLQELIYDVEDFLECLWVPGGRSGAILTVIAMNPGEKNLLRIKSFRDKIDSLDKRQKKTTETRPDQAGGDHSPTAADRSPPTYTPEAQLVGIQGPKAELLELLKAAEGQDSRTKLQVISIVGCHGGGKTALARAVHDHYRGSGEFDCVAWFEASGCKTADALLRKAPEQDLRPAGGPTTPTNLRTIPADKRYLVVIDDVHELIADVWKDSIKEAFPENGKSSRIIVTTSVHPVARACSSGRYVHIMQRLGEDDSERLFWKKVHTNPSPARKKGLENIFYKCDGLPLALTSVARHLALKGDELDRNDCEEIGKEFGMHLVADRKEPDAFEELRRALSQCYSNLPDYDHKNCLLSLSIFPRGHQIKSKSLVRRLEAEGLVSGDGRKCLNELIDRCIVEPVKVCRNSMDVKTCQVHGVMLESIIERSRLKNFLTLITKEHRSKVDSKVARIRRLSVQSSTKEKCDEVARGTDDGLSAMRSLTLFNSVPFDFQSCKMLRLLDLEGCEGLDKTFLDGICKLLLLKYLSLRNTGIDELPAEIKELQRLETLDIRETQVQKLRMEVIMLPRLAYLFGRFELPEVPKDTTKLEKFLSEESNLHTLAGFALNNKQGIQHIIISKAKKLKKVRVWDAPCDDPSSPVPAPILSNAPAPATGNSAAPAPASTGSGVIKPKKKNNSSRRKPLESPDPPVDAAQQSNANVLVSSLQVAGFYHLESVSIDSSELCKVFLESLEGCACAISSIKLRGRLVDSFTDSNKLSGLLSGLPKLNKLQLISTGLNIEFLSALQILSGLEYLVLVEDGDEFFKGSFIVEEEGFESLLKLCIEAPKMPKMQFKKGAMKSLTSLHLLCPDDHHMEVAAETVEGISNLAILNNVTLHSSATKSMKAWETVADGHPERPCVKRQAV